RFAAIDLIHQLAQHGCQAVAVSLQGNQVDVLENDHGRLQVACHAADFARVQKPLAADEADSKLRQSACQVETDRGLARARRPMEQDAALQVDAQLPEELGASTEAEHGPAQ